MLFGFAAFIGVIPGLSSVNVSNANVSVDCSSWPASPCAASVAVTNTGGVNPLSVYFITTDPNGQEIGFTAQSVSITSGQTQTVSTALPLASGVQLSGDTSYTLSAYVIDSAGYAGSTGQQSFTTPTRLLLYYPTGITLSVSPDGNAHNNCNNGCSGADLFYSAYYAQGTKVTATYTSTLGQPLCYSLNPGSSTAPCYQIPSTGGKFNLTIAPNPTSNVDMVIINQGQGVTGQVITVAAVPAPFTNVVPSLAQLTASSMPSATFSINVGSSGAPWTWTGNLWQIKECPSIAGGPAPATPSTTQVNVQATVNYADLQKCLGASSGSVSLQILGGPQSPGATIAPQLQILAEQGATTSPAAGIYSETAGQQVAITVTPASGWSFQGWIVNGVNEGTANPITVTMPSSGFETVAPSMYPGTSPPPPPSSSGNITAGEVVGFASAAVGLYLVVPRRQKATLG